MANKYICVGVPCYRQASQTAKNSNMPDCFMLQKLQLVSTMWTPRSRETKHKDNQEKQTLQLQRHYTFIINKKIPAFLFKL